MTYVGPIYPSRVATGRITAAMFGEDLQAALNAMPDGSVLELTPGKVYAPAVGLTTSKVNIEIVGGGGTGQYPAVGKGSTQIVAPAAGWGLTYNPAAASTFFQGPIIRGVTFVDLTGTAAGGLWIKRTNNWRVIDCAAVGFTTGIGFHSDGTGNLNQYPWLVNFGAYDCLIGVKFTETGGCRIIAPTIDAHGNDPSGVLAASTGIQIVSGATNHLIGAVIQGCAIGVDFQWSSNNNVGNTIAGLRGEACTTLIKCVHVQDSCFTGIQHNNANLSGGGDTGILLDPNSTENFIVINTQAVTTPVGYSSTASPNIIFNNGTLWLRSVEESINSDADQQIFIRGNVVLEDELFIGTAKDAKFYRAAASVLHAEHCIEFAEHADFAAGATNNARVYARDNGSGKTQLVVRFPTGVVQVLATEP